MELFKKEGVNLEVWGTSVRTPFFYGTTVASQTIPDLMFGIGQGGVHKVRAPACTHTREKHCSYHAHRHSQPTPNTHTHTPPLQVLNQGDRAQPLVPTVLIATYKDTYPRSPPHR